MKLASIGQFTEFPPDVVLFKEGDVGDTLFMIIDGTLEVTSRAREEVFLLDAGEVLGEIGLLDGLPRTATVTTADRCILFGLTRSSFAEFLALDPMLALNVMRVTNRKVRDALDREKGLNDSLREANEELERLNQALEDMVELKTKQMQQANLSLGGLLESDPLTGAFTAPKLDGRLRELMAGDQSATIAFFELDHFAAICDSHGRQTGDRCLIKLAEVATNRLSGEQHLIRFTEREFVLLLEDCELSTGFSLAESVCDAVEQQHFPIRGCAPGYVTVSMGVCQYPQHGKTVEELVASARSALSQAQKAGRNRAVAAS